MIYEVLSIDALLNDPVNGWLHFKYFCLATWSGCYIFKKLYPGGAVRFHRVTSRYFPSFFRNINTLVTWISRSYLTFIVTAWLWWYLSNTDGLQTLKQVLLCNQEILIIAILGLFVGRPNIRTDQGGGSVNTRDINSLHAKFFRGNINIYLHFVSLLHIDTTQVLKILPQVRLGPTYST